VNIKLNISGTEQLFRNIDKAVKWSTKDSQKLREVGHRVGAVYAGYIKANVKDLGKDITVRGGASKWATVVKSGQLRKSGGTWLADMNRNTILAGPRTNAIGKRKTKKHEDGWFAHIVEKGDFGPRFGGKHRTQNTGVFERGIRSTRSRSEKLQLVLLKKTFANYMNLLR
tara:strand:- start:531 stop:1040 length:510 start_codon:yes stop_codon:yes gene_type:complete